MPTEPAIIERAAQPYVAITARVRMAEIGNVVPPLSEEVFAWLDKHGVQPYGSAFWRYTVIDMSRYLQIEAGEPTAERVDGDERVHSGVLPAGHYATLRHIGAPQTLVDATRRLLEWADGQRLRWDSSPSPEGEQWGCRLEIYHTNPQDEPDMNSWETELAFRLAD
ncbi:GyrI-like domain-containing protein [Kribbella shirazensis]|uniref:Effector-binding domain-containing protein n=1 Tax=Kribbella shirazensis TaxID=1105143 RepID=A0A7X5VJB1_9ACTN|nr:effector-binding domain-containing protein [Kribbella shirazensis]